MYGREVDGEVLTFEASGWTWDYTFVLADRETHSLWWGGPGQDAWGEMYCVAGPYQGRSVSYVQEFTRVIWRTWWPFWPESLVMVRR